MFTFSPFYLQLHCFSERSLLPLVSSFNPTLQAHNSSKCMELPDLKKPKESYREQLPKKISKSTSFKIVILSRASIVKRAFTRIIKIPAAMAF